MRLLLFLRWLLCQEGGRRLGALLKDKLSVRTLHQLELLLSAGTRGHQRKGLLDLSHQLGTGRGDRASTLYLRAGREAEDTGT